MSDVREAATDASGVVSTQVLGEFFHATVTRKAVLEAYEAERTIRALGCLQVVEIHLPLVHAAISYHRQYQVRYWDALVLAAAVLLLCGCQPAAPRHEPSSGSKSVESEVPPELREPGAGPVPEPGPTVTDSSDLPSTTRKEIVRLASPSRQKNEWFGGAVAIDGQRVLVGCGGNDTGGEDTGCVYVFERTSDNAWPLGGILRGEGISRHVRFGYSVALADDLAVVGAERDESFSGSVFVFERDASGQWQQTAKLKSSDSQPNQLFGGRVAISGDLLLVGAAQDRGGGSDAGAAYLFQRDDNPAWRQVAKLVSSDLRKGDQLGAAVALSGATAVVGSRHNDENTGSVYVFRSDRQDGWQQVAKLKADPTTSFGQFGISVAVDGGTVLVGEWRNSERGQQAGAAYVFQGDEQHGWHLVQTLTASDATQRDRFGYAVALQHNRALIGTLRLTEGQRCGGAYLFERDSEGRWQQTAKFSASDGRPMDAFGSVIALSDDVCVVGAESQGEEVGEGAAYLFALPTRISP